MQWFSFFLSLLPNCVDSTNCAPGDICAVGSCCVVNVCVRDFLWWGRYERQVESYVFEEDGGNAMIASLGTWVVQGTFYRC